MRPFLNDGENLDHILSLNVYGVLLQGLMTKSKVVVKGMSKGAKNG